MADHEWLDAGDTDENLGEVFEDYSQMNLKTPEQINAFLERWQHRFETPDAYYGTEPNTYAWTPEQWQDADLHTVVCSPFDYIQAIGNNTIPLLYQLGNKYAWPRRVTERCYFPTAHQEVRLFRQHGIPLWGLETRHALGDYDVIGFPLNYSPYFVNIVKIMRMCGIPVRWRERQDCREEYPLVVVGGHIFADPWFPAPIADVIWCGEAEDERLEDALAAPPITDEKYLSGTMFRQHEPVDSPGYNAFLDEIAAYKAKGMLYDSEGREQMLHELATKFENVFIPRFYKINQERVERDGVLGWRVTGWTKRYEDIPTRPRKRFVRNLDAVPPLTEPVVPFHDPGMGLGQIQIARGCSYHCSFCAAAYREAPYRERSQALMVQHFKDIIKNTGSTEIAPLTLEFGTYSRKKALLKQLLEEVTSKVSMPSLRVDVFGGDPVFGQLAVEGQKANVTVAVEGNSQKLREIVSKGITEEDILRTMSYAIAAGYSSAKLYMVANLPGEGPADQEEIVQLCEKIAELKRSTGSTIRVRLSWKPLTVQANTPLQWFQARNWQSSIGEAMKKIQALGFGTQLGDEARSALGNFIQLAELADDVAGEILTDVCIEADAVTYGALPKRVFELIKTILARYGRTFNDYYRQKDEKELFAWDLVDTRITKGYLLRHFRKIMMRVNDDPELKIYGNGFIEKFGGCQIGCTACGACNDDEGNLNTPMLATMKEFAGRADEPVKLADIRKKDFSKVAQKMILTCEVPPDYRFVTRKSWMYAIRRAAFRAGIRVNHEKMIFFTDAIKCMKPWFAGRDYIEMSLLSPEIDPDSIPRRLNEQMGTPGFRVLSAQVIRNDQSLKAMHADANLWELFIDRLTPAGLGAAVQEALADPKKLIAYKVNTYRIGPKTERRPLNEVLVDAWTTTDGRYSKLVMLLEPGYSPYDAANAICGQRADILRFPAILRTALSGVHEKDANAFTHFCACGRPIPTEFGASFGAVCPRCTYIRAAQTATEVLA